ncbi:hypothetical protein [Streptomyces mirabilis]|uniref:hypothetical protein n=1 Tax=Streptomyces mirabilis TaxID=68239 RepID=UPI0036D8B4E3
MLQDRDDGVRGLCAEPGSRLSVGGVGPQPYQGVFQRVGSPRLAVGERRLLGQSLQEHPALEPVQPDSVAGERGVENAQDHIAATRLLTPLDQA